MVNHSPKILTSEEIATTTTTTKMRFTFLVIIIIVIIFIIIVILFFSFFCLYQFMQLRVYSLGPWQSDVKKRAVSGRDLEWCENSQCEANGESNTIKGRIIGLECHCCLG